MFFSRNVIVLSGTSSCTTWHLRLQISISVEHGLLIAKLQFSQRIQLKRKVKNIRRKKGEHCALDYYTWHFPTVMGKSGTMYP